MTRGTLRGTMGGQEDFQWEVGGSMPCKVLFFRSTIDMGFDFNGLQSRLPNIPVFGWLSMKNLSDDGGCSKYPKITDLHYNNKYWQIFKFSDENPKSYQALEVTFYLYGAYFDNRTLLPKGPMIRVISMVHSRFTDCVFHSKGPYNFTEVSLTLYPSVIFGIMTPNLQLSLQL